MEPCSDRIENLQDEISRLDLLPKRAASIVLVVVLILDFRDLILA